MRSNEWRYRIVEFTTSDGSVYYKIRFKPAGFLAALFSLGWNTFISPVEGYSSLEEALEDVREKIECDDINIGKKIVSSKVILK